MIYDIGVDMDIDIDIVFCCQGGWGVPCKGSCRAPLKGMQGYIEGNIRPLWRFLSFLAAPLEREL